MGLTEQEVERLRNRYPDRLQIMSRIADIDYRKEWLLKIYFIAGAWGALVGLFPFMTMVISSQMKKESHWDGSVSVFAKAKRVRTRRHLKNTFLGFGIAAFCYFTHCNEEREAAALWSINATHITDAKPKGEKFLDRNFPLSEQNKYATADQRIKVITDWENDNAMT
eukprot:TRINITY_DN12775_c0_g1_i1.p1 TRINITY_DN12775_c0_g1~~TRINITY_DN12775_c0_g1_i1.p1  ORF type:complete len:167 (+),score=23.98 TRINITY_DN12775_c0_g1_i1:52-552(+)